MRRYFRLLPVVWLLALTIPGWSQQVYQDEISVMERCVDTFNYCAGLIEKAEAPAEMTSALQVTADKLETVMPDMAKVGKEHPDWGSDTPAEVEPTMKLFNRASERLFIKALGRALKAANDNPDDQQLQKAFGSVNRILSSL